MASGRLIDYLGRGDIADRPAIPDLAPGGLGFYFAEDEETLYVFDGINWISVISTATTVYSIVAGTGIIVDDTDPENPEVSVDVDSLVFVESIVAGDGINVDASDPLNPVVSADINPIVEENVQTGTSYTLVLSDAFKMVAMANSSANTLTVPPDSAVDFPVGTRIDLSQDGTGQTTIAAGSGVTVRSPETLKIRKQYGKATLIKRAADTWDLEGNLEAAP